MTKTSELANFEGVVLGLGSLRQLTKNVAKLAVWGTSLWLNGLNLTSIDKEVAQELANIKTTSLNLFGLTSIDKEVAEELAKYDGTLFLKSLTSIDQETFDILITKPNIKLPSNLSPSTLTPKESPASMAETKDEGVTNSSDDDSQRYLSFLPRTITNSIGAKMVLLPLGKEVPEPLYISETEVTNAQGKELMGFVPSKSKESDHPIEMVSWAEATRFCQILNSKKLGRTTFTYRLPTEVEWEYACRAGSTTDFYFGDDESLLGEHAWFAENSDAHSHAVGGKKPNAWGLFDTLGNVHEWCNDQEVQDGSLRHFVRGGSYQERRELRPPVRIAAGPNYKDSYIGFRLAMTVAPYWIEKEWESAPSLTVQDAKYLIENFQRNKRKSLNLSGLTSIDKDVAQELAKFEGKYLYLNGLTSIDKEVAQELAKFKGNDLGLCGLTSIDKEVAQELAKFKGNELSLDGLTSIDKDVAQELAKFKGQDLSLDGLTSIDKDVAQELAKFEGVLTLHVLTSIDKNVAQELAKFEGVLPVPRPDFNRQRSCSGIGEV